MWYVAPKFKIQLVSCELSPKFLLRISIFECICSIDAYIFWVSFSSVLFYYFSSTFLDLYAQVFGLSIFQRTFFSLFSGCKPYTIYWSSDPHLKQLFWLLLLCLLPLLFCELKYELKYILSFTFLFCLKQFSVEWEPQQWVRFIE